MPRKGKGDEIQNPKETFLARDSEANPNTGISMAVKI